MLIGDGSEWIWQRAALFAHRCEILDFWHAMEYAWAYARLQFGEGARWADPWARRVAADLKAGRVQAVITRLHQLQPRSPEAAAARDAILRYYTTHAHRIHFRRAAAGGAGGEGAADCGSPRRVPQPVFQLSRSRSDSEKQPAEPHGFQIGQ